MWCRGTGLSVNLSVSLFNIWCFYPDFVSFCAPGVEVLSCGGTFIHAGAHFSETQLFFLVFKTQQSYKVGIYFPARVIRIIKIFFSLLSCF